VREVRADYYTEADLAVDLQVLDVLRADGGSPGPLPAPDPAARRAVVAGLGAAAKDAPGPDEDAAPDGSRLPPPGGPGVAPGPPGSGGRAWGEVLVSAKATIFKKLKLETNENLGWGRIRLPERQLHTTAYWVTFPADAESRLGPAVLGAALAGLGRALAALAPLHLLCDASDVQAWPQVRGPFTGAPTVFLWEAHPGGVGLAEKAFEAHAELLGAVAERIAACVCADGCPSCVGPPARAGGAGVKAGALVLLGAVR
jgi:ATP-dependent helicase YprA (DUF1998 family)